MTAKDEKRVTACGISHDGTALRRMILETVENATRTIMCLVPWPEETWFVDDLLKILKNADRKGIDVTLCMSERTISMTDGSVIKEISKLLDKWTGIFLPFGVYFVDGQRGIMTLVSSLYPSPKYDLGIEISDVNIADPLSYLAGWAISTSGLFSDLSGLANVVRGNIEQ